MNRSDTPTRLGTARNRDVASGVNDNAAPAGLGMARNRGVSGGMGGSATQAGLGMARDTGGAAEFDATEGVYGRSKLGVHRVRCARKVCFIAGTSNKSVPRSL